MAAEPLKAAFNPVMATCFAQTVAQVYPTFDQAAFVHNLSEELEPLELKERSFFMAERLRALLPSAVPEALALLNILLKDPQPGPPEQNNAVFFYWPISDFVEHFAQDFPEEAMDTNYWLTQRFTAEFSIRPFLVSHPKRVLELLHRWSNDESEHVRRLVSEGTRPRLPWAKQLPAFIENPEPLFPLLEKLLNDPSLYVRRSVANHLNDIGKDHPELVLDTIESWSGQAGEHFNWIVKHALRNHVKQGHVRALKLLGYDAPSVALQSFRIVPEQVSLGQRIEFSFEIHNTAKHSQALMVDYVLYRPSAKGKQISKVFKLKALELPRGATQVFEKTHRFQQLSTRTYYAGAYEIAVQVNGQEIARKAFSVVEGGAHE